METNAISKLAFRGLFASAILVLCCAACKSKEQKNEPVLKVAVITVGPTADAGFNQSHELGRRYMQKELGDRVVTQIIENISESADVERVMEKLILQGTKLIFATSYGYLDSALKIAGKHPDVIFMHCAGYKTASNLSTYFAYADEVQYLAGIAAGRMTKTGKLGTVAAHPIPNIVREINAFTLGAQSVSPGVTMQVVWTNSWYDPAVEAEATSALVGAGCDVIRVNQDSPISAVQTAERLGVYSVGCHADCSQYAPKGWITGHEWVWGKIMVQTALDVMAGTWTNQMVRGGLKEGYVKLAPFGPQVSDQVRSEIQDKQEQILRGEISVFKGIIKDQSGSVRLAEGQVADQTLLETMDWFVEGVVGSLPKTRQN